MNLTGAFLQVVGIEAFVLEFCNLVIRQQAKAICFASSILCSGAVKSAVL